MTGSNDLDRMLASYLEEGPRRAPDRAMDAALAFAVAHPRRRDPLLFLKPDVMARRTSMFSPQLVWVAAVIALTLAAVAAIAVGSRPSQEPVVPPSVVESPSPSVSPISVTNRRRRSSSSIRQRNYLPVDVIDESGRSWPPSPNPADVPPVDRIEAAANDPADSTRVQLVWTFCRRPVPHDHHDRRNGIGLETVERPVCSDTLGGSPTSG